VRTLARESPDIVASWHVDTISRAAGSFSFVFRGEALPMAAFGLASGWVGILSRGCLGIKDGEP
jgi:hypothetical protein